MGNVLKYLQQSVYGTGSPDTDVSTNPRPSESAEDIFYDMKEDLSENIEVGKCYDSVRVKEISSGQHDPHGLLIDPEPTEKTFNEFLDVNHNNTDLWNFEDLLEPEVIGKKKKEMTKRIRASFRRMQKTLRPRASPNSHLS